MNTHTSLVEDVEPPARVAMILVCEKCGNRVGDGGKNPSHRLASRIKKVSKRRCQKGEMRLAITSCMNACPDDRIAVCLVPSKRDQKVKFYSVAADDLDSTADALVSVVLALRRSAIVS